jgi:hypothetical protein
MDRQTSEPLNFRSAPRCGAKNRGGGPCRRVVSRVFRTFDLAERRPALAQAVVVPFIC